jgi:hypothetical protein
MKKSLSFITLLIMAFASCLDEPECYGLNNSIVGITFKNVSDNKSLVIDSLTIIADQTGTELMSDAAASKVLLPLNYFEASTSYTFKISDSSYQMVLGHTSQVQFVSRDCGERFVLSDLYVVSHSFDSVRLVNATPGANTSASNIEIFW